MKPLYLTLYEHSKKNCQLKAYLGLPLYKNNSNILKVVIINAIFAVIYVAFHLLISACKS